MKAVILAAGVGSRLKALTGSKPKCMVRVNGRCMIDYQVDALLAAGVEKIHVVVGFGAARLIQHIRYQFREDPRIFFVENTEYATTNNMYSLSLCAPHIRGDAFILMNGDVVFDASIIRDLLGLDGGAICVDVGAYNEESMKVICHHARVVRIAKTFHRQEALGSSIDVYRFGRAESVIFLDHILDIVGRQNRRQEWTEVALDELMSNGKLQMQPFDIAGRHWYEVDNLEDLKQAEILFGRASLDWTRIRLALVDMDGTLFTGNRPIAGAGSFFEELRSRVPHVYCVSNNSSQAHQDYAEKLKGMGVQIEPDNIVLSTDALAAHLKIQKLDRVYLVGTRAARQVLEKHGLRHDESSPQAVVLTFDTELSYEKLRVASLLLHRGLPYFATHLDLVCPTELGNIPDIGAMISLLETTTGRRPDQAFGKPQPQLVQFLLDRHSVLPSQTVVIGDRVYTDHELARRLGARFVGVLSGESARADYEPLEAIAIFPNVAEIFPGEVGTDKVRRPGATVGASGSPTRARPEPSSQ